MISTHSLPILTHTGIAHEHFCTHTHTLILSILFLWPMLTQDTWRPKEQTKSWQHQVAWLAAKGLHRLTKFAARRLLRLWTAHVVKCFHYSVSSFCIHQQQKAPSCTLVFRYSLSPISAVKLIWGRIESNGRKDHLLYLTVPPSPPPPPPVSVSLSYHWLAAGLTTRFG